jgi:predicted negative regulator of RcsB-dependent stress response
MMTLLRKLFWFALFLGFTLGFVTLFDHGYTTSKQFTDDAKGEVSDFQQLLQAAHSKAKSDSTPHP